MAQLQHEHNAQMQQLHCVLQSQHANGLNQLKTSFHSQQTQQQIAYQQLQEEFQLLKNDDSLQSRYFITNAVYPALRSRTSSSKPS